MTIYELDDILSLKDWDKISAEIEKRGFRQAGEVGQWEFKPSILHEQSAYKKSAIQRDELADREYYGTIFQENETYKGLIFITLTLFKIYKDRSNVSAPIRSRLFTDAPFVAEYVREINSPYKCDICGKEYIKKELCEYAGRLLCCDCLATAFDEECEKTSYRASKSGQKTDYIHM